MKENMRPFSVLSYQQFLVKHNIVQVQQPLYLLDLAIYHFFLFPKLKGQE